MCGIYLRNFDSDINLSNKQKIDDLKKIALLSSRRGSDSSGIFLLFSGPNDTTSYLFRTPDSPSVLFNANEFKKIISLEAQSNRSLSLAFGHTRMNTDGSSYLLGNNQPLIEKGKILVFNGIIVNADELQVGSTENDGYSIFRRSHKNENFFYKHAKGMINFIEADISKSEIIFYSNNGSLYTDNETLPSVITSEPSFHGSATNQVEIKNEHRFTFNNTDPNHETKLIEVKPTNDPVVVSNVNNRTDYSYLDKIFNEHEENCQHIERCSNCILPTTHPFLILNHDGVCNFCVHHKQIELADINEFKSFIKSAKQGKLLVGLSGGRDSCASIHELVNQYDIKPLTYTYDWGVNTNIARRNVSRICGELGLENVLIAADIRLKRRNVKLNLEAWLNNPHPGLIPLLMAGDKQFISNAAILKKERDIDHEIFGFNLHEKTQFKEEFSGVRMWSDDISGKYGEDLGISSQLKMILFYVKNGLLNPGLINRSLLDTARGFINYYHSNVDVTQFYEYHDWDEQSINSTLDERYGWEFANDTSTSWRIGDGTASFYNLAYYLLAGFTENDVIRSNLIRAGKLSRSKGLELAKNENKPRYPTLKWYCDILEIDFKPFIEKTFKQCIKNTLIHS